MERRYLIVLFISLFIPMIVFASLWFCYGANNILGDLFLSLSTTFLGSIITVFLVDRVMNRYKKRKMIPINASIHREVQLIVSKITYLWVDMYRNSVEIMEDITVEELFTIKELTKLINSFDLSSYPNVFPRVNWFEHLRDEHKDISSKINKVFEKYSMYLEPKIMNYLHNLLTDNILLSYLEYVNKMNRYDNYKAIPRPTLMSYYFIVIDDNKDLGVLLNLIRFVNENHGKYSKKGYGVFKINTKISNNLGAPLNSKMKEDVLEKQIANFNRWEEERKRK